MSDPWISLRQDEHDVCHVNIAGVDYTATDVARRLATYDALLADYTIVRAALAQLFSECDPARKEWYLMVTSEGMEAARAALIATKGREQ